MHMGDIPASVAWLWLGQAKKEELAMDIGQITLSQTDRNNQFHFDAVAFEAAILRREERRAKRALLFIQLRRVLAGAELRARFEAKSVAATPDIG